MKRLLMGIIVAVTATYMGFCLILFFSQRTLIYFPTGAAQMEPAATETLSVPDASLRLSTRPLEGPSALIYFGGNAEDVSGSLGAFADEFPDHAIYMLHYRGYGGSSGKPTEEALHSDARALYEMVHARHPDVIVVGRSLGSGVAVQLAATRQVTRLVLITPFDSIVNLASRQFPFVPVDLLLWDRFESWRYAPQVTAPTLIIAAANDEIVPRESTLALFNAFGPGVATMTTIAGAGHNSISGKPGYMAAVRGQE